MPKFIWCSRQILSNRASSPFLSIKGLKSGNLSLFHSKFPASITIPPVAAPWPLKYFVVEWITTLAPRSMGRASQGDASVLSTTRGKLYARAIFAIFSMSGTSIPGFVMVSI